MKTFLVIGHHKVGTTALQFNVAENLAAYRDSGVLYPIVESQGLEHLLTGMSGQSPTPHPIAINAREPHNALAFRILAEHKVMKVPAYHRQVPPAKQQFRTILAQQRALKPEATLMVSEVMSHFGFAIPDYIAEFNKQLLADTEVHIILVLRRPDEHIQSWYGQLIRLGRKLPAIRESGVARFKNTIHLQYRKLFEPWLQHIPNAVFHPVYYPDVMNSGGLVVYVNQILRDNGIDVPRSLDDATRRNSSYHPLLLEPLRRWVNAQGPLNGQQEAEARRMGELFVLPERQNVEVLGQENRLRIYEELEPQKQWFDETFGPGLLFNDFDKTAECRPLDDAEVRADPLIAEALDLIPGTEDFAKLG